MKNILITGVNGFVGKQLYHFLSDKNENFCPLGIYRNTDSALLNCHQLDLSNEDSTQYFIDNLDVDIDAIVHLASITAQADNLSDLSVLEGNAKISKNISKIAIAKKVQHFINMSSSSVYANTDGICTEEAPINPSVNSDAIYGLSKFNAEAIIDYFLRKQETTITHLRTVMIYGEGMNQTRIIPTIERDLLEKGETVLFGKGERMLNLIHVNKLIEYLVFLLHRPYQGVLNISDEYKSTLQIAEELAQKNNIRQPKILFEEKGSRTKFQLDSSKFRKIFNA